MILKLLIYLIYHLKYLIYWPLFMPPSSRKEPFLVALNKYIDDYVLDSFEYDPLYLEFYHWESTIGRKNIDISEYKFITRKYPTAHRLLSGRWTYVEFMDLEQFLHSIYGWIYTLKAIKLIDWIPKKRLFVPEKLVKIDTQDTIYYI